MAGSPGWASSPRSAKNYVISPYQWPDLKINHLPIIPDELLPETPSETRSKRWHGHWEAHRKGTLPDMTTRRGLYGAAHVMRYRRGANSKHTSSYFSTALMLADPGHVPETKDRKTAEANRSRITGAIVERERTRRHSHHHHEAGTLWENSTPAGCNSKVGGLSRWNMTRCEGQRQSSGAHQHRRWRWHARVPTQRLAVY